MRKTLLIFAWLLACWAAAQTRPTEGQGDGFYALFSSASGSCSASFLDIAASGTPLAFQAPYAAAGDPPAADDGGAPVALPWPFPFYGTPRSTVVVSPNGYLAFAATLEEEDGRDFSPDDGLPAVPTAYFPSGSPHFATAARLLPFHQDLDASTGAVLVQGFDPCPRPSEALGSERCTVVQWNEVTPAAGGSPLRFQLVLYHQSGQFVFQYASVDPSGGGSATVGFQGDGAHRGYAWSAKQPGSIVPGLAICGFAPEFPPGGPQADLQAYLAATPPDPMDPTPSPLELFVANAGPSTAAGVVGHLTLPSGLSLVADPCGASTGWSIGQLAPQGSAACTVTVQADGSFPGGSALFQLAATTQDPQPADNVASLSLPAADDGDGVAPAVEDAYPGGDGWLRFAKGDGNGDGIPDRQQREVATLPLASGKGWVTVEVTGCSALQQVSAVPEAALGTPDRLYDFPLGLVRFTLPCPAATVKLLYHFAGTPPATYRALGSGGAWQTLAATRVRDRMVWGFVISLADGGGGDISPGDGLASHTGGPAVPASSPGRR